MILYGLLNVNCQSKPIPMQSIAEARDHLDHGQQRWQITSRNQQDTYFFWLTRISLMGRRYQITGLQIENNQVHKRYYKTFLRNPANGKPGEIQAWQENRPGSRGNRAAIKPMTMSELYRACRQEILPQARVVAEIHLKINDAGAIQNCVVVPQGCQDDCSKGFVVSGIVYRKLNSTDEQLFLNHAFPELKK